MSIFPQLADSRLDHFFLVALLAMAISISVIMQAAVPATNPHQKSGIYMLFTSRPRRAEGFLFCTLQKIIKLYVLNMMLNSRAELFLTVFVDQKKNNGYAHIINCRQLFPLPRVDHCGDQTDDKGYKHRALKCVF